MDSVRFGRVLGTGARLAARALVNAVDAAAAPNPNSASASGSAASEPVARQRTSGPTASGAAQTAARAVSEAMLTGSNLREGSRQFAHTALAPMRKFSGVLWLEFTGFFFGLFAVSAGLGAWKLRADLYSTGANHDGHLHFLLAAAMSILFAYFCLTSFLAARRRNRL